MHQNLSQEDDLESRNILQTYQTYYLVDLAKEEDRKIYPKNIVYIVTQKLVPYQMKQK